MRRWLSLVTASVGLLALLPVTGARGAEPAKATLRPGRTVRWEGAFTVVGGNTSNSVGDQTCPGDEGAAPGVHECDVFELTVAVPRGYWGTHKGGVRVDIRWEFNDPTGTTNDFDMYVFKKEGGRVSPTPVASSAQGSTTEEHVLLFSAEGTYVIRVNPWLVVGESYRGKASFFPVPPIPKVPGGLTQFRASSTGYLSYSEPHIAINPVNPDNLVAGSKMYQNLANYLFKIGTYVSFDGGRTWKDNGHLPGYPKQKGTEDEYYITSDVWTAFDDEGNAYVMVLDAPSGVATGAGWGMTLHKSKDGGRTWSRRIPIHEYTDPVTQNLFLDDKNTMAVDNYGPDGDGKTGNMYACWSFDAPVANLAIHVARSTDAGGTWESPQIVSGVDRTVIGCYVVIGPPERSGEPGPVYVVWLNFADLESALSDGTGATMRMAKSTDGGETYSAPVTIAQVNDIPRTFANSAFRNFSLPYAGVDERRGTVYVTWSDWHVKVRDEDGFAEPCPPDEDAPKNQVCDADIVIIKSTDGGETWSKPARVNRDRIANGKDQFQPALAVTPKGQLNMMWFDRRNDPGNFYIDTYFARSNDYGRTWRETRLTKSMWDPSINPPISGSGQFIGDYQGIVATDRVAIPFWQDTTLANLPAADPDYSPYQEAFSARVPNIAAFGGPAAVLGKRVRRAGTRALGTVMENGPRTRGKVRGKVPVRTGAAGALPAAPWGSLVAALALGAIRPPLRRKR